MANWSFDVDLQKSEPEILTFLPPGETNFDKQHADAKEHILRDLINDGTIPMDTADGLAEAELRVLKVEELGLASRWKTLEIIYGFLSTDPDDKWDTKRLRYLGFYEVEYSKTKNALTIDKNDDAVIDAEESKATNPTIFTRF